jgi:hypothetical protein
MVSDVLLFLRTIGILHIYVGAPLAIGVKHQPCAIRAPDGHRVIGGIEGKPLGAIVL